jgi:hypothetical protein
MNHSTDIEIPDDPWMSHAFISKLMTQVSLPYRKPKSGVKEVVRHNGNLKIVFTTSADCLPYGKYPRLFELWACTMIKTENECFDPDTNTINLGTTFREFLRLINIEVGGRQLKAIKPQLERLFKCTYAIDNSSEGTTEIRNVLVAERAHIDWLRNEPQEHALFENTVQLSQKYVDYLRDAPVPVDLSIIARLNSPMSLDVYWWLTRRYSYLRERQSMTWTQLYDQFGSDSSLKKFKQSFRKAVSDVRVVYPQAGITCGRQYVMIYPSDTSVATTAQVREVESRSRQVRERADRDAMLARQAGREVSEGTIGAVLERLDYGEDYVPARRHVVHGLASGYTGDQVVAAWERGERL